MAKPLNLYQGGAPSTFSQMGDPSISKGIAEASRTMAEGVASGVGALAQGYLQGKEAENHVKSMEKMAGTIADQNIREPLLAYLRDTNISTSQKAKFGSDFFSEAIKNQYLMNLEREKEKSRMELLRGKQSLVPSAAGIPLPIIPPNPNATSSYMSEISGGPVQRTAAAAIPY